MDSLALLLTVAAMLLTIWAQALFLAVYYRREGGGTRLTWPAARSSRLPLPAGPHRLGRDGPAAVRARLARARELSLARPGDLAELGELTTNVTWAEPDESDGDL